MRTKRQTFLGYIAQSIACLTHYVSEDRLRAIGRDVRKVLVLGAAEDRMVHVGSSGLLAQGIGCEGIYSSFVLISLGFREREGLDGVDKKPPLICL